MVYLKSYVVVRLLSLKFIPGLISPFIKSLNVNALTVCSIQVFIFCPN